MTNDVSPQVTLAFLHDAWLRAANGANTLRDQLVQDSSVALQFIKTGSIASAGKNSANQSYKNYGPGSITQVQAVEIIGNLISLYDQIRDRIQNLFIASADFDYEEPAGYDYDPKCYEILTRIFTNMSAGNQPSLPDIRELRIPQIEETTS